MSDARQLRIVHLVRSPVGGIFRHIADLISAQAAAGHLVGFVCDSLTGGPFEDERIRALEPMLALGATRVPISRQISASDFRAISQVRAILEPLQPDVIHCHGAKGGAFGRIVGAWLNRRRPVARLYAPHGGSLHYDPKSLEGRIYFRVERALERFTDALIHVSDYERQAYVSHVGEPRCPAVVVRNGLTPQEFLPVVAAEEARDFLYLGMLRDLKGVDVFIQAVALLAGSDRPATAIIVGDGPDDARYRAMAADLGLNDLVDFRPSTPTREAFALGRAVVVPSRAESMPYVVLEAIAASLPIIATRVGGIPEIFGPFTEELIAPGDPQALAAAMAALIADPDAAAAGAAARKRHISGEFSVSEMSSRVEKVYRTAIGQLQSRY
ncbi:MAG TPA: glycosyltransferase family 4 protein [Hansschlegelia sp.]